MIRVVESTGMTNGEFLSRIKEAYAQQFPDSVCNASLKKMLGDPFCDVKCFIAGDISEISNQIAGNDLFHIWFLLGDFDTVDLEAPVPASITLDPQQKTIKTKPDNKYMAYGSEKLPFRKTTGDADKILKTFDKYFKILHDTTARLVDEDRIPDAKFEIQNPDFVRSKL